MEVDMKNISLYDLIRARVRYLGRLFISHIRAAIIYHEIYRNYSSVIFQILRNNYPIEAIDRNGNHMLLHNRLQAGFVTQLFYHGCNKFEFCDNKVSISSKELGTDNGGKLIIYDAISNGELFGCFFR